MGADKGKLKVESLILLSTIFIYLMLSFNTLALAAPSSPAASSSGSPSANTLTSNGVLHPSSKLPAGSVSVGSKSIGSEFKSGAQPSSELHTQQQSSTSSNQASASVSSVPAENNEIAHHNQAEDIAGDVTLHEAESLNGVGNSRKVLNGQRVSSFVEFPPFDKPISPQTRYQRQRRSYPMPSLLSQDLQSSSGPSFRFPRPDEMELRLDNDRDREAFLKLMSLIAAENNEKLGNDLSNRMLSDDLSSLLMKADDDESPDENDGDVDIDLGTFQRPVGNPYWTPLLGRPSEPINIMSSLLASEPPRAGSSHGLYGIGGRPELPLEIELASRARDDDTDGEWMEDSALMRGSHFKTRRSGNSEFTFNPVKSHFRRYMRAVPLKSGRGLEFIPNGGRFGSIVPTINRRRRATMTSGGAPAMHWM